MARILLSSLLLLSACASQQHPASENATGWSPVDQAELHGRCVGSWMAHAIEQSTADALCTCVTPRLTSRFSRTWFSDGREVTPAEAQAISDIHQTCARQLAMSLHRPGAPGAGAEGSADDDAAAARGTGSGDGL